MKKNFVVFAAAMLLVGANLFADEAVVIDFTLLDADCVSNENGDPTQNSHTVMDYSVAAGASYTDDQKKLMKTSLALPEWEVVLNASARTVGRAQDSKGRALPLSKVVAAPVKEEADVKFAGKNVMGVYVKFPEWTANANAKIVPPFDIPAYEPLSSADEDGNRQEPTDEEKGAGKTLFEDGYGVVKNVATIKALKVTTFGENYPHGLYMMLKDTDGVERRYFMGYLNFDGWKELTWYNPQYIQEIRNREIRIVPVYPRGLPFIKFTGFQITRDANDVGGHYIGYFQDVKVIYDKALLTTDRDIAEEDLWHIITDQEKARQADEMLRFGDKQVNRYLERANQATEAEFTSSLKDSEGGEQQGGGAEGGEATAE